MDSDDLLEGDIKIAQHAERARTNLLGMRRFEKDMFLNISDKAKEVDYEAKWREQNEQMLARLSDIDQHATSSSDHGTISEMRALLAQYERALRGVQDLIHRGE